MPVPPASGLTKLAMGEEKQFSFAGPSTYCIVCNKRPVKSEPRRQDPSLCAQQAWGVAAHGTAGRSTLDRGLLPRGVHVSSCRACVECHQYAKIGVTGSRNQGEATEWPGPHWRRARAGPGLRRAGLVRLAGSGGFLAFVDGEAPLSLPPTTTTSHAGFPCQPCHTNTIEICDLRSATAPPSAVCVG